MVRTSTHDIDAFHQAFKRAAWDAVESLEGLVELSTVDGKPTT